MTGASEGYFNRYDFVCTTNTSGKVYIYSLYGIVSPIKIEKNEKLDDVLLIVFFLDVILIRVTKKIRKWHCYTLSINKLGLCAWQCYCSLILEYIFVVLFYEIVLSLFSSYQLLFVNYILYVVFCWQLILPSFAFTIVPKILLLFDVLCNC